MRPDVTNGLSDSRQARAPRHQWGDLVQQYGALRAVRVALFGPPKAKALRPTGHSAFIERLRIPMIVAVSIALTCGATYVLARSLVIQFVSAIGTRTWTTLIPDAFALFLVVMTGLVLDYTFVTAATRFQMHALRGEWGWGMAAVVAMIFTSVTETATVAYLFYQIEPSSVSAGSVQIVTAIPYVLFWVRSAGALVCLGYLVMGVLPLVIQRGDLKRLAAARSGGTALSVMDDLLTVPGVTSRDEMVTALGSLFTIFDFSTRKPGASAQDASEFAELTEHLRRLNQVGAPTPRPQLPAPSFSPTQANRRMHDGMHDDGEDYGSEQGALDAYDGWEDVATWEADHHGSTSGTSGNNGNGRSRDHRPGQPRASYSGADQDSDPFGSGMYRPNLGNLGDYGQAAPNSRASQRQAERQAQSNGHRASGQASGKASDSRSAAIMPTSYTLSADPPASPTWRTPRVTPAHGATAATRRPKSARWDAGKTRAEISRVVGARNAEAQRLLDACDGQIGYNALARQLANLGYRATTRDARDYIRAWGADHGYHHVHLGDYPAVPVAAADAEGAFPGISDEIDHELQEGEDYSTWAVPDPAVQQMSDAARHAWNQQRAERDDPDSGLA